MSKITLNDVVNLESQTSAVTTINTNSDTIVAAFDNTLSRDGTTPNFMLSDIDMNSHTLTNLAAPVNATDAVRYQDINSISSAALTQAHTDATNAAASATASATSATASATSATAAAASATAAAGFVGAATSAAKWTTGRSITASTDATGTVTFDGSANFTLPLTLVTSGVTAASYGTGTSVPSFTVDAKGRLTAASNVAITSAPKWTAPITLALSGAVTGSGSVDGSGNVTIATTATGPAVFASGVVTISAGTPTVHNGVNIASVTKVTTGKFSVAFTSNAADAYYRVSCLGQRGGSNSFALIAYDFATAVATTGFTIICTDSSGPYDPARIDITVFQ